MIHEHLSTSTLLKETGPITSFIILTQSFTNSVIAYLWKYIQHRLFSSSSVANEETNKNMQHKSTSITTTGPLNYRLMFIAAFCYYAAMSATNESLNYVSYPTATLAKSSKLIPTMVMGILVEKKQYSRQEWAGVLFITIGIIVFNFSRLQTTKNPSSSHTTTTTADSPFGLSLLSFSLIMDGLLGSCQSMLKGKSIRKNNFFLPRSDFRIPTPIETMLYINLYSVFFLLPTAYLSGQYSNAIQILFPTEYTLESIEARTITTKYILLLNLCAALGQIFIFFTIHLFSPLMCTTITTTRKFFTILLSVSRFGHRLTVVQWTSVFMVFGGIYMEIMAKFGGTKMESVKEKKTN